MDNKVEKNLFDCHRRVLEVTEQFQQALLDCSEAKVKLFPYPVPVDDKMPDEIIPDLIEGREAKSTAVGFYGDYTGTAHSSNKITRKLPGAFILPAQDTQIVKLINDLNREKEEFKQAVFKCGDNANQRYQYVHQRFPMLILLQIYRQVRIETRESVNVRFSWAHKSSVKNLDKENAINFLNNQLEQPRGNIEDSLWQAKIHSAVAKVRQLPASAQIQYRRKLCAQPMGHTRLSTGRTVQFPAHSPLLIMERSKFIHIASLPMYIKESATKRQKRFNHAKGIMAELDIYLKD